MLKVVFLLYPQVLATSISLPIEMLNAADNLHRIKHPHTETITIDIAALSLDPVVTTGGITLTPNLTIETLGHYDLIVLPALWRNPRPVINSHQILLSWLVKHNKTQKIICAVGTGTCILAASGLLDGKSATTHWHNFDQFEAMYPKVHLRRNHLITQAGNLYCAGSVNSIADLMVHFISQFYDKATAHQVEGQFSPEIRQSYDKHLYSEGLNPSHPDEDVARIQYWLQSHLNQTIKIRELAELCDISVRSLNRRFKNATQQTPMEYLQQLRMATAKDLLQESNLSIAEIAFRTGYADGSHFSAMFKKHMAESPNNYRRKVRGKVFSSDPSNT